MVRNNVFFLFFWLLFEKRDDFIAYTCLSIWNYNGHRCTFFLSPKDQVFRRKCPDVLGYGVRQWAKCLPWPKVLWLVSCFMDVLVQHVCKWFEGMPQKNFSSWCGKITKNFLKKCFVLILSNSIYFFMLQFVILGSPFI